MAIGDTILISGFGESDVNGIYTEMGTINDYPYYKKDSFDASGNPDIFSVGEESELLN